MNLKQIAENLIESANLISEKAILLEGTLDDEVYGSDELTITYDFARKLIMNYLNGDTCKDCLLEAFDLIACECGLVHLVEETE